MINKLHGINFLILFAVDLDLRKIIPLQFGFKAIFCFFEIIRSTVLHHAVMHISKFMLQ